jgi:DNA invertase Pin-like site-specific DNA recombinase
MIFTVLGAVAELERNLIQERIHMGLQRARKQGKQLGRPKIIVDRETVRKLYAAGNSVRTLAAEMGLSKSMVHSVVVAR